MIGYQKIKSGATAKRFANCASSRCFVRKSPIRAVTVAFPLGIARIGGIIGSLQAFRGQSSQTQKKKVKEDQGAVLTV
jgi:hypothetical protein